MTKIKLRKRKRSKLYFEYEVWIPIKYYSRYIRKITYKKT